MIAAEGSIGRVFVLRLEQGDRLPECIERFAGERGVVRGVCWMVGGVGGGRLVVGPEDEDRRPVVTLLHELQGVHEAAAVGMLFPTEDGTPRLHMHAALGRDGQTRTGCVRLGIDVWQLGEVVLLEVLDVALLRRVDPDTGFEVLAAP
jgi:predicted DNA-binding protein with PD1-like motif